MIDGFILTREAKVTNSRDGFVRGSFKLRTPRGVGSFDFRYFRGNPLWNRTFKKGESLISSLEKPEDDDEYAYWFPLARSNIIIVEVQGEELFEAMDYILKNLKDRKRYSSTCLQFSALMKQVHTLHSPVHPKYAHNPTLQAHALGAKVWEVVVQSIQRGHAWMGKIRGQLHALDPEVDQARQEYESHVQVFQDLREDEEDEEPEALKLARVVMKGRYKEQSGLQREEQSIGSALFSVLCEVASCGLLFHMLSHSQQEKVYMERHVFLVLDEQMFSSHKELLLHLEAKYKISSTLTNSKKFDPSRMPLTHECISPTLDVLMPRSDFYESRFVLIQRIQQLVDQDGSLPSGVRLIPFGSSVNFFGSQASDVDLCLVMPVDAVMTATEAVECLTRIVTANGFEVCFGSLV